MVLLHACVVIAVAKFLRYVAITFVIDFCIVATDDCWSTCGAGHTVCSHWAAKRWHIHSSFSWNGDYFHAPRNATTAEPWELILTNPENTVWQFRVVAGIKCLLLSQVTHPCIKSRPGVA